MLGLLYLSHSSHRGCLFGVFPLFNYRPLSCASAVCPTLVYNFARGNRSPHLPAECPMTTHRLFRRYILNCAICTLALTVPEFARTQDCFIRLNGNVNVNYLEVTVDTRDIGSNEVLEDVSFDVTLNVKDTDKRASFDFTDDEHRFLSAGRVYQRYVAPFPSGIGLQAWIVAGDCQYRRVLSWAKSDTGLVNRLDRKPLRKSHPPEPSRVIGKAPPQFWP